MGSRAGVQSPGAFLGVVGAHVCLDFGNTPSSSVFVQ